MPDSSINSWESWFIFNLRKINANWYYKSVSLIVRNHKHITEHMTWHENEHIIITVHTWKANFLKYLANTPFMASFQAWTEPHSGLSLWACILLPCLTQYFAVYYSGSGFTPNVFLLSGRLLPNVQVNNITMLHAICAHMYIHHIALLFFSSFYTSSILLGWLADPDPSCRIHLLSKTIFVFLLSYVSFRVRSSPLLIMKTGSQYTLFSFFSTRERFTIIIGPVEIDA